MENHRKEYGIMKCNLAYGEMQFLSKDENYFMPKHIVKSWVALNKLNEDGWDCYSIVKFTRCNEEIEHFYMSRHLPTR